MLIYCPACRNQLRVQDEFIGRKVRCPMCASTFEATSELPVSPPSPVADGSGSPDYEEIVEYDPSADPPQHAGYGQPERGYRPRGRPGERPGKAQAIAIMTLIGGILATLVGLGLMFYFAIGGLATVGVGFVCCLWPGPYYSVVLGVMAIVKGAKLLGRSDYRERAPSAIAIMQIVNVVNCDFANCIMGILTLVFLNEPELKRYYRR